MEKNVELLMAFEFQKAPKELKEAAESYKLAWERLQKAKAQILLWQEELFASEKENAEWAKKFRAEVKAWDLKKDESKLEELKK